MTFTVHAPIVIKQRRLEALKLDLAKTLKECSRHFFAADPKYNTRHFVVAADTVDIPKGLCSRRGSVQRSRLREHVTTEELGELIKLLCAGKYQIKLNTADPDVSWTSYRFEYTPYDELA